MSPNPPNSDVSVYYYGHNFTNETVEDKGI